MRSCLKRIRVGAGDVVSDEGGCGSMGSDRPELCIIPNEQQCACEVEEGKCVDDGVQLAAPRWDFLDDVGIW